MDDVYRVPQSVNLTFTEAAFVFLVPVAFDLLFVSCKMAKCHLEISKVAAVTVLNGIQETLENICEIRSNNQEKHCLNGLYQKNRHTRENVDLR